MDNINSSTSLESTEIYFKKVLAGNIRNVRLQLMDAIENLGYDIIDDEPHITARRGSNSRHLSIRRLLRQTLISWFLRKVTK